MSAPEDRILEHALERKFKAPTDDLSYRVLARLRGHEATSQGPRRAFSAQARWIAAGAAATLLAALGIWLLSAETRPLVVAERAVARVASDSPWNPERATEFDPGDTLVLDPDGAAVEIRIGSRSTAIVGPGSVLTFVREDGIATCQLRLGSMFVEHRGAKPLRVTTPVTTATLTDPARIEFRVHTQERPLPPIGEDPMTDFHRIAKSVHGRLVPLYCVLGLTVLDGTAMCQQQSRSVQLTAGNERVVSWEQDKGQYGKARVAESTDKKADENLLMLKRQVGTWDIEFAAKDYETGKSATMKGTNITKPGPGDGWIVSDFALKYDRIMRAHFVLGYDVEDKAYVGTMIQGKAKDIVVLRGKVGSNPREVVLKAESGKGEWKRGRIVLRWISKNERVMTFDSLDPKTKEHRAWATLTFRRRVSNIAEKTAQVDPTKRAK